MEDEVGTCVTRRDGAEEGIVSVREERGTRLRLGEGTTTRT